MKIFNKKISYKFQIFIILIITFLVYLNIFQNDFVFDDNDFIISWQSVKNGNFISLLKGEMPVGHEGVYRPIKSIIHVFSYRLFGLNPQGYHIQSLLVHLLCILFVYLIIYNITKNDIISSISALFFGVHPVHVEAVTFITASFDTIGALFFFISFYFYIKRDKYWQIFSILFSFLAFFTYELTLVLPFIMILYDIVIKKKHPLSIKSLKEKIPYFVLLLFYFFARVMVSTASRSSYIENSLYYTSLISIKVFFRYLLLIIIPFNLNINHTISEGIFARRNEIISQNVLSQSIFNFNIVLPLLFLLFILYKSVKVRKKYSLITFGIFWFFLCLIPVSNIIPLLTIFAEKYLYIASFGYCLILGVIFDRLLVYSKKNSEINSNKKTISFSERISNINIMKIAVIFIFIFLGLFYSFLTVLHNSDFKNEYNLWSKTVDESPNSAFALNGLGLAQFNRGLIEDAKISFQKSISINPFYSRPYTNLANAFAINYDFKSAIKVLETAVDSGIESPNVYANLGAFYRVEDRLVESIDMEKKAILIEPTHINAHFNLGVSYYLNNESENAINEFKIVSGFRPNLYLAYYYLGKSYMTSDIEKALDEFNIALKLDPKNKYSIEINEIIANYSY